MPPPRVTEPDAELETLLEFIRDARGFDFTGYKRSSLSRRIRKRMDQIGVGTWNDYRDRLEIDADEFGLLFNTILINVTSFFRDIESWRYLQRDVVPEIIASLEPGEEIRIWSAGCSSGEEPFSLAIVMAEALGREEAQKTVKIYATDVDEEALQQARAGTYSAKALAHLPPELRDRYFESSGAGLVFRADLRRRVIFGRHDVTRDAPISRLDLLVCRNTLMYFNVETQNQILERLHFALKDGGFLFLGKAEMLVADSERFEATSMRHRVFRRRPGVAGLPRHLPQAWLETAGPKETPGASRRRQLREHLVDVSPHAVVALDADGIIVAANHEARSRFDLGPHDLGRPFRDHELSYRPAAEVRSLVEQATREHRPVWLRGIESRSATSEPRFYDVGVHPLSDGSGKTIGTSVSFIDVTEQTRLQRENKQVREDLETAQEELQSTNEELETTNEELQSSIEELETTNEELQSTNEELETTNEELQSGNEELETMNEELRIRSTELDEARSFLESVLTSVGVGVVVLDERQDVQGWNATAEDLWGLRRAEVQGQPFAGLDFGLPTAGLADPIRSCLTEHHRVGPIQLPAVNRRGRSFTCSVTCTPLAGPQQGVVILMEAVDDQHMIEE